MNVQQIIRTNARNNQRLIIDFLNVHYLKRENGKAKARPLQAICLFCAGNNGLTAEHVLPRWVFERNANRFFNTTINGLSHKYNQTTIEVCRVCNNNLLSTLEKHILQLFSAHNEHQCFSNQERQVIVRWLEILDYKYQVFSLTTSFRALKGKGPIEFLSDFPLSVLDPNVHYSPSKVMRNLRDSLHRIASKSKEKKMNSLVVFKTKNSGMHFFHKNNDFIFLELPKFQLALFYFYQQTFDGELEAKDAAMEIIQRIY
jgi:hypothetical protein